MSWLKDEAANIPYMLVTLSTAQSPMSLLKDEAPVNILYILVMPEVSQAPMSLLKVEA